MCILKETSAFVLRIDVKNDMRCLWRQIKSYEKEKKNTFSFWIKSIFLSCVGDKLFDVLTLCVKEMGNNAIYRKRADFSTLCAQITSKRLSVALRCNNIEPTLTFVLTGNVERKRDSTSVSLFDAKSRLLSAKLVSLKFSTILFVSFEWTPYKITHRKFVNVRRFRINSTI